MTKCTYTVKVPGKGSVSVQTEDIFEAMRKAKQKYNVTEEEIKKVYIQFNLDDD